MDAYLYVYQQLLIFLGLVNIVAIAIAILGTIGLYILGTLLEVIEKVRTHATPANR